MAKQDNILQVNVAMEIPRNTKNQHSHKLIIKPKHSLAHLKSENADPDTPNHIDYQPQLFLSHMVHKSKHFKDLLDDKGITNQEQFINKHIYSSVCLKTIVNTIIERMVSERRLGKNLKGLNKSNLLKIQNQIWPNINKEIELYKNNLAYNKQKQQLQHVLALRKQQIMEELAKLRQTQITT